MTKELSANNTDPLLMFYNRTHALFSTFSANIHEFVKVLLNILSQDFKADRLGFFLPMLSGADKVEYVLCGSKSNVIEDKMLATYCLPSLDIFEDKEIVETPTDGVGWDAYLIIRKDATKEVLAVLSIDDTAVKRKFTKQQRRLMILVNLLLKAIFNERAKVEALIYNDQLTGLLNQRGYLYELEKIEAERRRNKNLMVCVAAIDIDYFRAVNSRHGEPFGNIVLKAFAQTLKDQLRGYDIICRWGGDEFYFIFKNELADNILRRLQGILQCCQNQIFRDKDNKLEGLSFSGGVQDVLPGVSLKEAEELVFQLKKEAKLNKKPCLLIG